MSNTSSDPIATAGALIRFVRALNMRLREREDGFGMALTELTVLGGIAKGHDLASTLVRVLMVDAPRVSRIVDGFVSSGYVSREADPDDRRRLRLRLTTSGAESLARGRAALGAAMEELLEGLTAEERGSLEQVVVPGMRRVLAGESSVQEHESA